jgi:hypothetical protein
LFGLGPVVGRRFEKNNHYIKEKSYLGASNDRLLRIITDYGYVHDPNRWLDQKIAEGYTVVDIGLDPKYVQKGGAGSKTQGPYYRKKTQVAFEKKW